MKKSQTPLGTILEAPVPELYQYLVDVLRATIREVSYPPGVALTGGSSPLGFYQWLVEDPQRFPEAVDRVVFTVSDERCVPTESNESNYGNALRRMMEPLGVSVEHRFPWDTQRIPSEAASWYQKLWELSYGNKSTYDLCMLGMGDDAHTASLFPGSPLLMHGGNLRCSF
jgi:6-phosphogluconolactonase